MQNTSRRQVSLAVESDQVIAGHIAGGASVYSISNWLDEQLCNPLATPKRSFHRYITQLYQPREGTKRIREKTQNNGPLSHGHLDALADCWSAALVE